MLKKLPESSRLPGNRLTPLPLMLSGLHPAVPVSQRVKDNNLQTGLVTGNGVDLVWAPAGPGWRLMARHGQNSGGVWNAETC